MEITSDNGSGSGQRQMEYLKRYRDPYHFNVDISDALMMQFDGPTLKHSEFPTFDVLLELQLCSRSVVGLHFFTPQTITRSTRYFKVFDGKGPFGVLKSAFKRLADTQTYSFQKLCYTDAIRAVNAYNTFLGKKKLKFVRLVSANKHIRRAMIIYVTFSALDLETLEHDIYQAAGLDADGVYYLGLLKKQSSDKLLALISVTGVDEDLEAKREYMRTEEVLR